VKPSIATVSPSWMAAAIASASDMISATRNQLSSPPLPERYTQADK
jgi:hypothetical protein